MKKKKRIVKTSGQGGTLIDKNAVIPLIRRPKLIVTKP